MSNIESNTLLEKLTQINSIKNRLRQAIINIGGGEYINEQSPFSLFPNALYQVHSDINTSDIALEYIVNGGNFEEIIAKQDLTYKDIANYIVDIQNIKSLLVDNLRIKGVSSSIDEPLKDLVDKVLTISGGDTPGPIPPEDNIVLDRIVHDFNDNSIRVTIEYINHEYDTYYYNYKFTNMNDYELDRFIYKESINGNSYTNVINERLQSNESYEHTLTSPTPPEDYRGAEEVFLNYIELKDCNYHYYIDSNLDDLELELPSSVCLRNTRYYSDWLGVGCHTAYLYDSESDENYSIELPNGYALNHLDFINKYYYISYSVYFHGRETVYNRNVDEYEENMSYSYIYAYPNTFGNVVTKYMNNYITYREMYDKYCEINDLDPRYADIYSGLMAKEYEDPYSLLVSENISSNYSYDYDDYDNLNVKVYAYKHGNRNLKITHYFVNSNTKEIIEPKTELIWPRISEYISFENNIYDEYRDGYTLVYEITETELDPQEVYYVPENEELELDYGNITLDCSVEDNQDNTYTYSMVFTRSNYNDAYNIDYYFENTETGATYETGFTSWDESSETKTITKTMPAGLVCIIKLSYRYRN